jgi:hypothetical protein
VRQGFMARYGMACHDAQRALSHAWKSSFRAGCYGPLWALMLAALAVNLGPGIQICRHSKRSCRSSRLPAVWLRRGQVSLLTFLTHWHDGFRLAHRAHANAVSGHYSKRPWLICGWSSPPKARIARVTGMLRLNDAPEHHSSSPTYGGRPACCCGECAHGQY